MYVWTDKTVEVWELHKLFAFAFVPGNGWEVTMAIIFSKNGCTWRQQQVLWWTFSSPASPLMHASCTIDKRECIQWPLDIVPGPQSGPYLLASNGHWFKVQWVSSCPRKKQCIHMNHWKLNIPGLLNVLGRYWVLLSLDFDSCENVIWASNTLRDPSGIEGCEVQRFLQVPHVVLPTEVGKLIQTKTLFLTH